MIKVKNLLLKFRTPVVLATPPADVVTLPKCRLVKWMNTYSFSRPLSCTEVDPITGRLGLFLYKDTYVKQYSLKMGEFCPFLMPLNPNQKCLRAVRLMKKILKANADLPGIMSYRWQVVIHKENWVNALAYPTGTVKIMVPMMNVVKCDHQLSLVIGHEISHVLLRHINQQMSVKLLQLSVWPFLVCAVIVTALSSPVPLLVVFSSLPVCAACLLAFHLMVQRFSRRCELAADHLGLYLAARARVDVRAAVKFYGRFKKRYGVSYSTLQTHPSMLERIRQLVKLFPVADGMRDAAGYADVCRQLASGDYRETERPQRSEWRCLRVYLSTACTKIYDTLLTIIHTILR